MLHSNPEIPKHYYDEIAQWMAEGADALGVPDLDKIPWEFDLRRIRCLGAAKFYWGPNSKPISVEIIFSWKLWPHVSKAQRKNTTLHELAHVYVALAYGKQQAMAHGGAWKSAMHHMGEEAEIACSDPDILNVATAKAPKKKQVEALCACSQWWLSPRHPVAKGKSYKCATCHQFLELTGKTRYTRGGPPIDRIPL